MKRALALIVLGCIWPTLSLQAFQVEVFHRVETLRQAGGKTEKKTYPYGIFVHDTLADENRSAIESGIAAVLATIPEESRRGSVFMGADFFLLLPEKPGYDAARADAIREFVVRAEELGARPIVQNNVQRSTYVLAVSDPNVFAARNMVFPDTTYLGDFGQDIESLHDLRLRQQALGSERTVLEHQIVSYSRNRRTTNAMLASYKSFGQLYADVSQTGHTVEGMMRNPASQNGFKNIIGSLYNTDGPVNEFKNSARNSDTRRMPDRYLTYNDLMRLVSAQPDDASIRMLRKYLFLLNAIFLNFREIPELRAICRDPYSQIRVLSIKGYKLELKKETVGLVTTISGRSSSSYEYVEMGDLARSLFLFNMTSTAGKEARFVLTSDSPVVDLAALRDMEPMLKRSLSQVKDEAKQVELALAKSPLQARYTKVSTAQVSRDYFLFQHLPGPLGASEDAMEMTGLTANILLRHGGFLTLRGASIADDPGRSAVERLRRGAKEGQYLAFDDSGAWLIGKRAKPIRKKQR